MLDNKHGFSPIIIACDFNSKAKLFTFLNKFSKPLRLKLGTEILYSEGFELIQELKALGHWVMVDLKLYDIPTTMIKTLKVIIEQFKADLITIHLLAGRECFAQFPAHFFQHLIGVSILTSYTKTNWEQMIGQKTFAEVFTNLIKIAGQYKFNGVVCHPEDVSKVQQINSELFTYCPGISAFNNHGNDQPRAIDFMTAKKYNVNYFIIGRAITSVANPEVVYNKLTEQFQNDDSELI